MIALFVVLLQLVAADDMIMELAAGTFTRVEDGECVTTSKDSSVS